MYNSCQSMRLPSLLRSVCGNVLSLSVWICVLACLCVCFASHVAAAAAPKPWERGTIFPDWADAKPNKVFVVKATGNATQNGSALLSRALSLKPGQALVLTEGVYELTQHWDITLKGNKNQPIWIVAAPKSKVVIKRSGNKENLIDIGAAKNDTASYVCLRGFILTGGDTSIRFGKASNVWIDQCDISGSSDVGIASNTDDTDHLYITRNKITRPGKGKSTSEGMYLGANHDHSSMHDSVIAFNQVSECHGVQGDGIEIKQGSYDNWIVGNLIFNCSYPCITAYGNKGKGVNVFDSNVCYGSDDNVMQVGADAIVRNNVFINGKFSAFSCSNPQGGINNLVVVNNTFINKGNAVELREWSNKKGMIFGNNACYSMSGMAIRVTGGIKGAQIGANVAYGGVDGISSKMYKTSRNGLRDFVALSLDGKYRDARPANGSALIGAGYKGIATEWDLYHLERSGSTAGAVEPRNMGVRDLLERKYPENSGGGPFGGGPKQETSSGKKSKEPQWKQDEPGPNWEFKESKDKKDGLVWWPPEAE